MIDAGLRSVSTENKIRTEQVLLQSCIDSPDDMSILAIDKQYNYLAFNAYYYKIMLQSCGTEIKPGMNLFDCMKNKEDKIKVKIDYDRAMAGQSFIAIEESGEMDGQYFETRYNPIYNKKNEITGATAFSVNVTERKQMELALNEKSNDLHKELEKKRNAEIALQKSHKILEKSKLATINLLEDINLEMDQRKHAEEELSKLNDELEHRVTERTAQLEAVNNELQAFAYSVSHDLRAPLRAIDGFSKFMLDGYGTKLDPEGKRLLGLIRSNTQKMDQLIIDILALSKVTRSEHKVSKVDMTKMVMSMLNEIASPEIQANLSILIDPQNAYADPTYIKQV